MATEFSRNLSLLRRERNISQADASSALGISQALMSHYETGAREPKYAFLTKACNYYDVSADFMLGRTMLRDGERLDPEALHDAALAKDNRPDGRSITSIFAKKLVINTISLLFDIAGKTGNKELIGELSAYFGSASYKIFRRFYNAAGENPDTFFQTPRMSFAELTDADMKVAEAKIEMLLSLKGDEGVELPALSNEMLNRDYPQLAQSLLTVTHQANERANKRL